MKFKKNNFLALSKKELFKKIKTSESGLSFDEAEKRIKIYGKNELPKKRKGGGFLLFLRQFNSVLIYILFIAAFISWEFEHYIDAYVILVIVFINAFIGFFQRWRAEKILEALKNMVTVYTRVVRNGVEIRLEAKKLVFGDIVIIEAGDNSPADIRLIESKNVRSNESSLTGESLPVEKNNRIFEEKEDSGFPSNMLFMGTSIISGYAKGVVVATGSKTKLGSIAEELKKIKYQKSHFEKKVDELAIQMGIVAFLGAVAIFLIGFFFKGLEFFDIFLFSVAALVAGVPEGLPAVMTIVLAIGASRMAKKNAIIKHLPSVETLGVANIICTDKTGTLTKNILTIKKIFAGSDFFDVSGAGMDASGNFSLSGTNILPKYYPDLEMLLDGGIFVSDASITIDNNDEVNSVGEPVEIGVEVAALKSGIKKDELLKKVSILDKMPFDTRYKYKANLINFGTKTQPDNKIYFSGAFEVLLEKASYVFVGGKIKKLDNTKRKLIFNHAIDAASDAMKVIGVAFKKVSSDKNDIKNSDFSNLVFLGFFGMIDPPKENVKDAIKKCGYAGVRVLMLTGDHKKTAVAIAKEIGLMPKEAHEEGRVITEFDIKDISDDDLKKILEKAVIFARVTPETKLKIAKLLQEGGNVVAMTGDGINDAPALKQAHIGISMGIRGTDVAKEASDIILTDDNFASVVNAIIEGRIVFNNVKKTSFYLITTNVAEGVTIFTALSVGLALPLLPIQLLWLNLVTDGITVIALASEPKQDGLLNKKPRSQDERILGKDVIPLLFFTVIFMVLGTIALFLYFLPQGIDKARTVAFTFMAFSQLFNVVNMRSLNVSIFKIGFFSNKFMVFALFISVVVQLLVIYTPFFQKVFRFESLDVKEWILIIISSSLIFFVIEFYKAFKRRS
jgi:Ca2+-transporting ATPase